MFHGWQCQGHRGAALQPGLHAFNRSSDDPPGRFPVPGASTVGCCTYRDTDAVSVHSLGGLVTSRRTAQRNGVRRDYSPGSGTVPFSSVLGQTYNPQSATMPGTHAYQYTLTRVWRCRTRAAASWTLVDQSQMKGSPGRSSRRGEYDEPEG